MKKEAFNYCLKIFTHWNEKNSDIRDELLFSEETYIKIILDQFSNELGENISNKVKIRKKRELIKFYTQQFNRALSNAKENKSIWLDSISLEELIANDRKANQHKMNFYNSIDEKIHILYLLVFNELQLVCIQNNILFLEICKEVNFPLETIDLTITRENQKKKESTSPEDSYLKDIHPDSITQTETTVQSKQNMKPDSTIQPDIKTAKALKSKEGLIEHGFYNLELVQELSSVGSETLIDFISSKMAPYQIAMLEYLGFIKYFEEKYSSSKINRNKRLGKILSVHYRNVQGNINVQLNSSEKIRKRYTSYLFRSVVKEDYQKIKAGEPIVNEEFA